MMDKTLAKIVLHIIGLGCIVAATVFNLWVLLTILGNGYFPRAVEGNTTVLLLEIGFSLMGMGYSAYLVGKYAWFLRMIPKEVRKEMKLE